MSISPGISDNAWQDDAHLSGNNLGEDPPFEEASFGQSADAEPEGKDPSESSQEQESADQDSEELSTGERNDLDVVDVDDLNLSEASLPQVGEEEKIHEEDLETSLREHNVGDEAENSELLKSVEKVIGDGAGIGWHYADPDVVDNPEAFKKYTRPYILPGRTDISSFLYFGGLTASGYPWRDFATKIFERSGWHTEVYPLAGHDGRWANLRDTHEENWIEDIRVKAQSLPTPPVIFCYSTSLPAALEVEKRHPGTFRAIVGIGGPFFLKNEKLETYLSRGLMADRIFKIFTFGQFSPLRFGSVPMRFSDDRDKTDMEKKSPSFDRLPLPTALSLRRVQLLGRKAAESVTCPFFYGQGSNDEIVHDKTLQFLDDTIGSEAKEFHTYPDSAHSVMLGVERYKFLDDVTTFLGEVFKEEPVENDIPDFKTRIPHKAAGYLIREYLEAILRREEGEAANEDDFDPDARAADTDPDAAGSDTDTKEGAEAAQDEDEAVNQ